MASVNKVTIIGNLGRDPEKRYLPSGMETVTLKEAANILKCHEQTVRQLAKKGTLNGRKIGRAWVFLASDIEKLFRQCDNENRLPVPERKKSWHFTKEARSIGPVSQRRTEQELDALLARQTARRRKSSLTS